MRGAQAVEGALRLGDVNTVVPGRQADGELAALGTALAMDPVSVPQSSRRSLPEVDVRTSERFEQTDEDLRIVLIVMEAVGPQVLVPTYEFRLLLGEDPADAGGGDQLGIGDMADTLEHRPLRRLRADAQQVACIGDELAQAGRRLG